MFFDAIKANLQLSVPIIISRLLGIVSNVIAMMIIAKIGTDALSASALIMAVFSISILIVMSFGFVLSALIAEYTAKRAYPHVGETIISAAFLNALLALPFIVIFVKIEVILIFFGQPQEIAALVQQYLLGLLVGFIPMLWGNLLEQFFVAVGKIRVMMIASLLNLCMMPILCDALIFGKLGLPALSIFGAGLASTITAIIVLVYLIFTVLYYRFHDFYHIKLNNYSIQQMSTVFILGWPIALQFISEFSAYTLLTLMMGWVGAYALAAQQIILQLTTVVIMIPNSVSQATTILVATVKNNLEAIHKQTMAAITLVTLMMALIAILYVYFPIYLISFYLDSVMDNERITSLAITFLLISAISQCFDGVKNVITGALRGLRDTKKPMLLGGVAIWMIGIPLAYLIGFYFNFGPVGIRAGFAIGLIIQSIILLRYFSKFTNAKSQAEFQYDAI